MGDQSLLLVGSNGLMFFDQEATRGKLIKLLYSTELPHLYKFQNYFALDIKENYFKIILLNSNFFFDMFVPRKNKLILPNFPVKKLFVNGHRPKIC